MKPIVKNILAVIAGVFGGGFFNMGIIMISGSLIPPPEGAVITTMEGLKASMHLMEPKHFLMPFLAHALGTLVGAAITALISANHKMRLAIAVGVWFMIGGLINIIMLPSPLWFTLVDLGLGYIPMAYIGAKLVIKKEATV
jgi:hypothetical protein